MQKDSSAGAAMAVPTTGKLRGCAVGGCGEGASGRKPFCAAHWAALPGRTRSKLSLSGHLARTERSLQGIRAAAALLEGQANG